MPNVIVSAHVPAGLAERIQAAAAADDRSVSYVVRRLLEGALKDDDPGSATAEAVKTRRGRADATG